MGEGQMHIIQQKVLSTLYWVQETVTGLSLSSRIGDGRSIGPETVFRQTM